MLLHRIGRTSFRKLEVETDSSGVHPGEGWRGAVLQTVANRLRKSRPLERLIEDHASASTFESQAAICFRQAYRPDQTQLAFSICFPWRISGMAIRQRNF